MRTMKVNTATRESDELFKTDKYLRCAVTNGKARLDFIPDLFFTPLADNMAASWLRQHSEYNGGSPVLLGYSTGCWREYCTQQHPVH